MNATELFGRTVRITADFSDADGMIGVVVAMVPDDPTAVMVDLNGYGPQQFDVTECAAM